jgi:predicted nucleic acid-binding protein
LIFADTSFLVSLYLPNDRLTTLAATVAADFRSAIAYPLLTELELTNTLWRAVGQKRISNELATNIFRDLNRDLVDGFLQQCGLDAVAHYHKAIELSRRCASQHLTRSLDVLHVAAACLLETLSFASLDTRQRKLAASVGLKLLPADFTNTVKA